MNLTLSWVIKTNSNLVHTSTFSIKTKFTKVIQHQFQPKPNGLIKAIAIKIQFLTSDAIKSGSFAHEITLKSLSCSYDASSNLFYEPDYETIFAFNKLVKFISAAQWWRFYLPMFSTKRKLVSREASTI